VLASALLALAPLWGTLPEAPICHASAGSPPSAQAPSLKLTRGMVEVDLTGQNMVRVDVLDLEGRFVQELPIAERVGDLVRYVLPQPAKEGLLVVRVRARE
jgi:hypothetical protein